MRRARRRPARRPSSIRRPSGSARSCAASAERAARIRAEHPGLALRWRGRGGAAALGERRRRRGRGAAARRGRADRLARDRRGHPLHYAGMWGRASTVELLLARGADAHAHGRPARASRAAAGVDGVGLARAARRGRAARRLPRRRGGAARGRRAGVGGHARGGGRRGRGAARGGDRAERASCATPGCAYARCAPSASASAAAGAGSTSTTWARRSRSPGGRPVARGRRARGRAAGLERVARGRRLRAGRRGPRRRRPRPPHRRGLARRPRRARSLPRSRGTERWPVPAIRPARMAANGEVTRPARPYASRHDHRDPPPARARQPRLRGRLHALQRDGRAPPAVRRALRPRPRTSPHALAFARERGLDVVRARRRPLGDRRLPVRRRGHRRARHGLRRGRPGPPRRPRRRRRHLGAARPRDAGARPRHHRRSRLDHRRRGPHARRRLGLAGAQARPRLRQPARRRARHRRRRASSAPPPPRTPSCCGRCAAAAATSASSPRSSSRCTRSARRCSPGCSSIPRSAGRELLRRFRDLMRDAPDELSLAYAHLTVPEDPGFPAEMHGRPAVAIAGMWSGDVAEGERVLADLRAFGPPGRRPVRARRPTRTSSARSTTRPATATTGPPSRPRTSPTRRSTRSSTTAASKPAGPSQLFLVAWGGARRPRRRRRTRRWSARDARFVVHPLAMWEDAADDARGDRAGRAASAS